MLMSTYEEECQRRALEKLRSEYLAKKEETERRRKMMQQNAKKDYGRAARPIYDSYGNFLGMIQD